MSNPEYLADRAVLRIGGADRKTFLQGLTTQDVDALSQSAPIFTALLTPQGKILFDFFVHEGDDELLIDCDRETAPALAKRLTLYKLRAAVTIEQDDTLGVFTSAALFEKDGKKAAPDPRHEGLGWRLIANAGETPNESGAYNARRIANGVPEFGKDYAGDQMFLMDVNYDALSGVSYQKGCFVGQEVTSRMKRKGDARKRTLIAEFDGPTPEKGMPVTAGDSTLGEILSVHKGRALAMIRLDRWEKSKTAGAVSVVDGKPVRLSVPDYLEQD